MFCYYNSCREHRPCIYIFSGVGCQEPCLGLEILLIFEVSRSQVWWPGPRRLSTSPPLRVACMDTSSKAGVIITVVLIEVVSETHQSFPHHSTFECLLAVDLSTVSFSKCTCHLTEQPPLHQTSPGEVTRQLNEASQAQITLDVATPPSTRITILTIVHEIHLRSPPNLSHITCVC